MPIYAYKCQACGHNFEKLQRISETSLTDCPECNQPDLKKQVTAAAFKLKGTGWYETDFKNKKPDKDKETSTDKVKSDTKQGNKAPSDSQSKDNTTKAKSIATKDAA